MMELYDSAVEKMMREPSAQELPLQLILREASSKINPTNNPILLGTFRSAQL